MPALARMVGTEEQCQRAFEMRTEFLLWLEDVRMNQLSRAKQERTREAVYHALTHDVLYRDASLWILLGSFTPTEDSPLVSLPTIQGSVFG
jgi:hypothetical protein